MQSAHCVVTLYAAGVSHEQTQNDKCAVCDLII